VSVLPIYLYGHPVLRKKAKPVLKNDSALSQFAADMVETMKYASGIGLAATQVGDLRRVIVVDIGETSEETRGMEPLVMINPVLIREADSWVMEEGCLSIPDIRGEVERAETITVSYTDLAFEQRLIMASGLLGRVILHEIDHLNGVLFLDYLGATKQKLLKGRLNKIRKGEIEARYPVVAAEGETEHQKSNIKDQR
jgi:peptide deformylase